MNSCHVRDNRISWHQGTLTFVFQLQEDLKVEEELDRVLTARGRREKAKAPAKVRIECQTFLF